MIWLSAAQIEEVDQMAPANTWQIPLKTYVEKSGTFINYRGDEQKIRPVTTVVAGALSLSQASQLLAGKEIDPLADSLPATLFQTTLKTNEFVHRKDKI